MLVEMEDAMDEREANAIPKGPEWLWNWRWWVTIVILGSIIAFIRLSH